MFSELSPDEHHAHVEHCRKLLDTGDGSLTRKAERGLIAAYDAVLDRAEAAERERDRLDALINNPHTDNFLEAVRTEAAHQRERWPSEHDASKTDADWYWLIGYLAGKALHDIKGKRLHHTITTAAACLNWHAQAAGVRSDVRPGIEPSKEPRNG